MNAYDSFYKRLIAAAPLKNVTSHFAMERLKSTTMLPIFAQPPEGAPEPSAAGARG
jgi:Lrp/AsnC family transcriptional regulator, cysteine-sensing transcriptional activator